MNKLSMFFTIASILSSSVALADICGKVQSVISISENPYVFFDLKNASGTKQYRMDAKSGAPALITSAYTNGLNLCVEIEDEHFPTVVDHVILKRK